MNLIANDTRVCVVCHKAKPIAIYYGDTKICPSCNASTGIETASSAVSEKHCGKCNTQQPLTSFGNNSHFRNGKQSWCKSCMKQWRRDKTANEKAAPSKTCRTCAKDKPKTEFHVSSISIDGRNNQCKTCSNERHAFLRKRRREKAARREAKLLQKLSAMTGAQTVPVSVSKPWWHRLAFWRQD